MPSCDLSESASSKALHGQMNGNCFLAGAQQRIPEKRFAQLSVQGNSAPIKFAQRTLSKDEAHALQTSLPETVVALT